LKLSKSKEKRFYNVLHDIIADTAFDQLESKIIYKEGSQYKLFGQYTIDKVDTAYHVSKINVAGEKVFSDLRYAVAWSTLDKLNRVWDANRICQLDKQLADTTVQYKQHSKLLQKAKDIDTYVLFKTKIGEDLVKQELASREINEYVRFAKNWQNNVFRQATK
jgi:hypothetical protein